MAQAAIDSDRGVRKRASRPSGAAPSSLSTWTRRIVAGEASVSDVPARNRARVAREVKAYADRFPDVGRSATVRRLIDDLKQAEVSVDEY